MNAPTSQLFSLPPHARTSLAAKISSTSFLPSSPWLNRPRGKIFLYIDVLDVFIYTFSNRFLSYVLDAGLYTVAKANSFPSMDGNGAPKSVNFVDVG
jgi:hypothetical protein